MSFTASASISTSKSIVPLGDLDGNGTGDFALSFYGAPSWVFLYHGPI